MTMGVPIRQSYDPAKRYRRVVWIEERDAQGWSLNEEQELLDQERFRLGASIWREAGVFKGLTPTLGATGQLDVNAGTAWLEGRAEPLPASTLTFPTGVTTAPVAVGAIAVPIGVDPTTLGFATAWYAAFVQPPDGCRPPSSPTPESTPRGSRASRASRAPGPRAPTWCSARSTPSSRSGRSTRSRAPRTPRSSSPPRAMWWRSGSASGSSTTPGGPPTRWTSASGNGTTARPRRPATGRSSPGRWRWARAPRGSGRPRSGSFTRPAWTP